MRWMLAPLALIAGIGLAQAQPLAPGEVELHIEALGTVAPDTAMVPINLVGTGPTEAAAKADLARKEKELLVGLAVLGIAKDKARFADDSEPRYAAVSAAVAPPMVAAHPGTAPVEPNEVPVQAEIQTMRMVTITVEDLSKVGSVTELSSSDDYYPVTQQNLYVRDPDAARIRAAELAIASARGEADVYAAALGLRVVRMVRVSNAKPGLNLTDIVAVLGGSGAFARGRREEMQMLAGGVTAAAQVDFVLAPK